MTDSKKIMQLLSAYMNAFPSNKVAPETLLIYAAALSDLSLEQLRVALKSLLKKTNFFPSVAEIIREAAALTDAAKGIERITAAEAYEEVMRQAKSESNTAKWVFSTPEIEKAANQFGRIEIITIPAADNGIARAQFMRIYDSVIQKEQEKKSMSEVLGSLGHKELEKLAGVVVKQIG